MKIGKIEGNDYDNLIMNDAINAFRIAVNGTLSVQSMVDGFVDEYEDENGIDTTNSVNELYNSTGNYYSLGEGETTTVDTMEYATDGDAQANYITDSVADGNTKLLLYFDGTDGSTTIPDATNNHTITAFGTAHIESDVYKWGTTSLYLDGNSDYLSIPDSADWYWGTGDFTVDCWINFTDTSGYRTIFSEVTNGNDQTFLRYNSGYLSFQVNNGGSGDIAVTKAWIPTTSTWYHVALIRTGDDFKMFINGTQIGTKIGRAHV